MREYNWSDLKTWFSLVGVPKWAKSVTVAELSNTVHYWNVPVCDLEDLGIDWRHQNTYHQLPDGIQHEVSGYFFTGSTEGEAHALDRPSDSVDGCEVGNSVEESTDVVAPPSSVDSTLPTAAGDGPDGKLLVDIFTGNRTLDSLTDTVDNVNHPSHYTSHPSGVECIEITEHYDFCVGNAIKYLWRAGLKQDADKTDVEKEIEDLQKAKWYIERKIALLNKVKEA